MTDPNEKTIDWEPTPSAPGDTWRSSGWILVVLGGIGVIATFLMDTTVPTDSFGDGAVVNFGLLSQQGLILDVSLFAIGLGVFCLGVGSILEAISRKG